MKINLNDLYLLQGDLIKKKIKKGDYVEISFENIQALGASVIQDLKLWVFLPNVQLVDITDFVRNQLADQLGVVLEEPKINQISLF